MKLFGAIKNLLRQADDDAAKALSDPVRDGKFIIEDSEKVIKSFETDIAALMASINQNKKKRDAAQEQVDKYQRFAQLAAQAQNTDDARKALENKNLALGQVNALNTEIQKSETVANKLREQLNTARQKVASARSNVNVLAAQHSGAKIRKELAQASAQFGEGNSPLAKLNDLQAAVDKETAEAEAYEALAADANPDAALEAKYGATGNQAVDAELAALMAGAKKDPAAA